jgi:hypothetical protein
MSELSVGKLKGLAVNSNVITVPSGHTLYAPGHVLQAVQATKTGTFTTTSTSFVAISGLSLTITPKSATSQIFLTFSSTAGHNGNNLNFFTFFRNGSNVAGGTQALQGFIHDGGVAANQAMNIAFSYIDSPATTTAITYAAACKTDANTMYVGERPAGGLPTLGTLIALEIAQ